MAGRSDQDTFETCPNCDASYDVSGLEEGREFECQLCGELVVIGQDAGGSPIISRRPSRRSSRRSGSSRSRRSRSKRSRSRSPGPAKGKEKKEKQSSPPGDRTESPASPESSPADESREPEGTSGPEGRSGPAVARKKGSRQRNRQSGPASGKQNPEDRNTIPIIIGASSLFLLILIVVLMLTGGEESSSRTPPPATSRPASSSSTDDEQPDREPDVAPDRSSATGEKSSEIEPSSTGRTGEQSGAGDEIETASAASSKEEAATDEENEPVTADASGSASSRDEQQNNEDGSTTGNELSKEWTVDRSITEEILRAFEGARTTSSSKLKEKRQRIRESYPPEKLIPAAIQAIYDTDSGWTADQANKILREITEWSGAPKTWKPLDPDEINMNARSWKRYWMRIDWEKQKVVLSRREERRRKMKELKPLCRKAANALPTENEGTRNVRQKGEAYLPVLIELLKGKHADDEVAEGANVILRNLTGNDFGDLPSGDRSRLIQKWTDWWKKNGDEFSYD